MINRELEYGPNFMAVRFINPNQKTVGVIEFRYMEDLNIILCVCLCDTNTFEPDEMEKVYNSYKEIFKVEYDPPDHIPYVESYTNDMWNVPFEA